MPQSIPGPQGSTGADLPAGDECPDRGWGRDRRCPYDNPSPGAVYSPGPGTLQKLRETKYPSLAVITLAIKNEVLMFWWSRESKLRHFVNYNDSMVARYDGRAI